MNLDAIEIRNQGPGTGYFIPCEEPNAADLKRLQGALRHYNVLVTTLQSAIEDWEGGWRPSKSPVPKAAKNLLIALGELTPK